MYTVTLNGNYIHHPNLPKYNLFDAVVDLGVNTAGSFVFSIYPSHPMYSSFERLKSVIEVFDDGEMIFRGRILNDTINIDKKRDILCEGDLAFLNDSVIFPYSFNGTPKALLQKYIEEHNAQTDLSRRFELGNVTVVDNNDYIVRSNIEHTRTWTEITDKTIDIMGGYLILRRFNDKNYIDWLKDSPNKTTQTIELSRNLLEFNQEINADEIITVLVPLGAKIKDSSGEKTEERLTIESVNGKSPYIQHDLGVERYGRIVGYQVFDDITNPSNLKTKGMSSLNQLVNLGVSTTIKAVDMNMVDKNIKKLRFFEYVRVVSNPHNLDEYMLIKKQSINLTDPSQNTISVGVDIKTFTQNQHDRDKIIRIIKSDYVTNSQLKGTTDPLIKQISEINQKYNMISLSVEEIKDNIPRGNLLTNSSNQLGYEGWTFEQLGSVPGFEPPKRPMVTTSPTYLIIPSTESLSGMSMVYDSSGKAYSSFAAVYPDTPHSFRMKRLSGRNKLSIEIHEFENMTQSPNKVNVFDINDDEEYPHGTVELLSNTRYIKVVIVTQIDTNTFNPLVIGELMFNRGSPSIWQESAIDVFNYAKAELNIQKDMIEARVEKNGIIAAINLSSEVAKIMAKYIQLEGIITANGNIKIFEDGSIEVNKGVFRGEINTDENVRVGTYLKMPLPAGESISEIIQFTKLGYGGISWGEKGSDFRPPVSITAYDRVGPLAELGNVLYIRANDIGISGDRAVKLHNTFNGTTASQVDLQQNALFLTSYNGIASVSGKNGALISSEKEVRLNAKENVRLESENDASIDASNEINLYGKRIHVNSPNFGIYVDGGSPKRLSLMNKKTGTDEKGVFLDEFGNLLPWRGVNLGWVDYQYANIYLQNQPNVSSDKRYKYNVSRIDDMLLDEFEGLERKSFKTKRDNKFSFGYIAQDVERCLYKYILKVWGYSDANDWLRMFKLLSRGESYLSLLYAEVDIIMAEVESRARKRENEELRTRLEEQKELNSELQTKFEDLVSVLTGKGVI